MLAHQLNIFDALPQAAEAPVTADIITKDPIFLADVPIVADSNVRQIEITTVDVNDQERKELRDGKVFHRRAPHPTYVKLGNTIVHRDEIKKPKDTHAEPVMVDVITSVIYHKGVVQQSHLDVFFALLHLVYDRYQKTGIAAGQITVTRLDLMKILGMSNAGKNFKMIDAALNTLSGLHVAKYFQAPEGLPDVPIRVEEFTNLLLNPVYESAVGRKSNGRRPETITVTINSALVDAMRGRSIERSYVVRSLNFTQNLKHAITWRRQYDRLLQARLERGPFRMPLKELWISCLGGNVEDLDPAFPARWRKIRHKIITTMKEWEKSGFLEDVQYFTRDRRKAPSSTTVSQRHFSLPTPQGKIAITLAENPLDDDEWVSCRAGSEFYAGRPSSHRAFARELLRATVDDHGQIGKLLKEFTVETVVSIAHRRLKTILTQIGQRMVQMRTSIWLGKAFPQPDRTNLVHYLTDLTLFRLECNEKAQVMETIPAELDDRRDVLIAQRVKILRQEVNLQEVPTAVENPLSEDTRLCYRITMDRIIAHRSLSRDILDPLARQIDPKAAKLFESTHQIAETIAYQAALTLHWYDVMNRRMIEKIGAFGSMSARLIVARAYKRWPQAAAIVREMQSLNNHPWEQSVGALFERRLCEALVVAEYLDEKAEGVSEQARA